MGNKTFIAVAAAVILIGLPVGCTYIAAANKVATAPARVVDRTFDTNNILENYEMFFNVNGQIESRLGQINAQKSVLKSEEDPSERSRLRMELSAMQQSCRGLVTQYNADAAKQNRALFKSKNLPSSFDINICE